MLLQLRQEQGHMISLALCWHVFGRTPSCVVQAGYLLHLLLLLLHLFLCAMQLFAAMWSLIRVLGQWWQLAWLREQLPT